MVVSWFLDRTGKSRGHVPQEAKNKGSVSLTKGNRRMFPR